MKSAELLSEPWAETPLEFARRMRRDVTDLNKTCNVKALCYQFPERLRQLVQDTHGDRLSY